MKEEINIIKIKNYKGKAEKLSGRGTVEYCLWVDNKGTLYVQLIDNKVETNSPGTFSDYLYPVSKYAGRCGEDSKLELLYARDSKTFEPVKNANNNDAAFLKAVLQKLLPCNK